MSRKSDSTATAQTTLARLAKDLDAINPRLYKRLVPYLDAVQWALVNYPLDHAEIGDPDDEQTVRRRAMRLRTRMRLYAIRCDVEPMFAEDTDLTRGQTVVDALQAIRDAVGES